MNKQLLKKISFVALILITGFSFEYLFYRTMKEIPSQKTNSVGIKKVLVVGGSIIDTITPGLRSVFQSKRLKGFEFFSLSHPLMSSELARQMISDHLNTLKPDLVLLLIGMHEKSIKKLLSLERREKFLSYVLRKDSEGLNRYIITVLNEILQQPNAAYELGQLHLFLHSKEVIDLLNPEVLAPALVKMIDIEVQTFSKKEERILNLFMISENILVDRSNTKNIRIDQFLKNFDSFLRYKGKFEGKELFIATDSQWRNKLSKMAGKEDLHNFLLRSPDMLLGFGIRLYLLTQTDMMERGGVDPRMVQIIKNLKKRHTVFGLHGNRLSGKNHQLMDNISSIKTLLAENSIPLILLQYPNTDWEGIKQVGKELGITVVKNQQAFRNLVTKENYFKFFIDRTGDTGHLTEYGSEIYGRTLVEQLPEYFK